VFGVAAFTDVLDGAVARRLAVGTQVGAYLDPVADKCLLSGVFLALAWANLMPWWVVAIIFGRDIYILAGVAIFLFFTPVRGFPPSVWGKVSTFVQICTVAVWMSRVVFGTHVLAEISAAMLWPCVGFTVWSGLDYTWKAVHLFRKY
jgi:cardiolipin synthase (CMP-forming)